MNKKIKIKKYLEKDELKNIYSIVKEIILGFESGEINSLEASNQLWWKKEIVEWRKKNNTDLVRMFERISSLLHPMILDGYKKILNPPFEKSVKIPVVFGTQLGLVRDNNLIKWDDDMDVVMDIHDLHENKNEIIKRCEKNNWTFKEFSSFNEEYEIEGKGAFISKLLFKKKIILDFDYFKAEIIPTIDIFHGINVSDNITSLDIENYTSELFNFYFKKHRDYSNQIINSKNYKLKAPRFWEIVKEKKFLKDEINLSEWTRKLHNRDSNSIMHINISAPKLIIGKYDNNETISLSGMDFLISDNWDEQLTNEYNNWKTPYMGQFHFFNLDSIKLNK